MEPGVTGSEEGTSVMSRQLWVKSLFAWSIKNLNGNLVNAGLVRRPAGEGRSIAPHPPPPLGMFRSQSLVMRQNWRFSEVPISGTLGYPENFGQRWRDLGQFSTTCPG